MKKLSLLVVLCLIVLAAFLWLFIFWKKDNTNLEDIDVTETWFEYNIAVCDKYFNLIECIIDNDPNENWDQQMKLETKAKVKEMQDEWKELDEDELIKKCTNALESYEKTLKDEGVDSFGCITTD